MPQQFPDALIKDLSKADVVAVLRDLFEVEESDFMDHPSFRDADSVDPVVFPDQTCASHRPRFKSRVRFSPQK